MKDHQGKGSWKLINSETLFQMDLFIPLWSCFFQNWIENTTLRICLNASVCHSFVSCELFFSEHNILTFKNSSMIPIVTIKVEIKTVAKKSRWFRTAWAFEKVSKIPYLILLFKSLLFINDNHCSWNLKTLCLTRETPPSLYQHKRFSQIKNIFFPCSFVRGVARSSEIVGSYYFEFQVTKGLVFAQVCKISDSTFWYFFAVLIFVPLNGASPPTVLHS